VDLIEFISRPFRDDDRESGIQIKINGRDLVGLVRAVENPFADKEGHVSIAGAYAGLPPNDDTCPPSKHFLGQPSYANYRYDAKTQVLGCECGEAGCWPLVCLIEAGPTRVKWSQFEQPHRTVKRTKDPWRYDELGPFEFDRSQYERALEMLRLGSR
jgi:hypothetical protein